MAALTLKIHSCSPTSQLALLQLLKLKVLLLTIDRPDSKKAALLPSASVGWSFARISRFLHELTLLSNLCPWRLCCGKRERKHHHHHCLTLLVIDCGDQLWHKGNTEALVYVLTLTSIYCAFSERLLDYSVR